MPLRPARSPMPTMPTWSVRIHYSEPSYALVQGRTPELYGWTWTGEAPTAELAAKDACLSFRSLFVHSGVGWVRIISSVETWQVRPARPGIGAKS